MNKKIKTLTCGHRPEDRGDVPNIDKFKFYFNKRAGRSNLKDEL